MLKTTTTIFKKTPKLRKICWKYVLRRVLRQIVAEHNSVFKFSKKSMYSRRVNAECFHYYILLLFEHLLYRDKENEKHNIHKLKGCERYNKFLSV